MVFNAIVVWLLVAAVPLWIYRWVAYSRLSAAEQGVFKRLVARRQERAIGFALRIFGFLAVFAATVIVAVFSLRYLKYGTFRLDPYREMVRSRFYSGVEPVDQALDTFHYNQMLPVAILTTCLLLSIAFTLVAVALRDISLIRRLRRRLKHFTQRSGETAS
ncbi:hypothetical protein [Roseibium marinum]|uniref:Uncharacterized protein n=1 Tax=Roseibium marinum TaxID=281252 RepID=A0A2S3UPT3_9HYPH|nr:hypothetical protein [Roseibium marinum]POF29711.1 hypothetical protein CLV41_108136 [Roseibium marinum]